MTFAAAAGTLVVACLVVAGPAFLRCADNPDGLLACLRQDIVEIGLLPPAEPEPPEPAAPQAPAVPAETNPAEPDPNLVRVEPDGHVIVAGTAQPGIEVEVFANGNLVGKAMAEASGDWVVVPDRPLAVGRVEITVGITGSNARSPHSFTVVIPEDMASTPVITSSTAPEAGPSTPSTGPAPPVEPAPAPYPEPDQDADVSQAAPVAQPAATSAVGDAPPKVTADAEAAVPPQPEPQPEPEPEPQPQPQTEPASQTKPEPQSEPQPPIAPDTPAIVVAEADPAPAGRSPGPAVVQEPVARPEVAKPQDAKPQDAKPQDAKPQDAKPETSAPETVEPAPVAPAAAQSAPTSGQGLVEAPAAGTPGIAEPTPQEVPASAGVPVVAMPEPKTTAEAPPDGPELTTPAPDMETPSPHPAEAAAPETSPQPAAAPVAPDMRLAEAVPEDPTPDSTTRMTPVPDQPPSIDAIEIDGGANFFAGAGPEGATVELFVQDRFIASAKVEGGRWLIEAEGVLTLPRQRIRIDLYQPQQGTKSASAAVNFVIDVPPPAVEIDISGAGAAQTGASGSASAAVDLAAAVESEPEPDADVPTLHGIPSADPAMLRFKSGKAIIRRGETLWAIARRVYGDGSQYQRIFDANRAVITRPGRIFPGQVFDLPPLQPADSGN